MAYDPVEAKMRALHWESTDGATEKSSSLATKIRNRSIVVRASCHLQPMDSVNSISYLIFFDD